MNIISDDTAIHRGVKRSSDLINTTHHQVQKRSKTESSSYLAQLEGSEIHSTDTVLKWWQKIPEVAATMMKNTFFNLLPERYSPLQRKIIDIATEELADSFTKTEFSLL